MTSFQFLFLTCWMRCILMATFCFQKEIRDQVRSMSAGDSAHTGGEEGAGLRLPPALLCLHCMQAATCDRWRVLSDGGQQAGLQGRLRDRQAERWAADMIASRVTDRKTVGKSVCQTPGSGMLCVSACFKQPAMTDVILKLWPTCANCIIASKPINTKLHKAQVRRITSALCTGKDQLSITLTHLLTTVIAIYSCLHGWILHCKCCKLTFHL